MNAFINYAIKQNSTFKLDDFLVWGGSMVRTPDRKCHLLFSLWPRNKGFEAWVTDSEIGYAVADTPLGPYEFKRITFRGSGKANSWDRDVVHNPNLLYWDNKFYLYYTGNWGDGTYWKHHNNQRIGVAVAENPEGPWIRFDKPLLDVNTNSWDCLLTSNPSVSQDVSGRFVMIYKAVDTKASGPLQGPVMHGVAFADSPLGPFKRHPVPVFTSSNANFAGEDPFVFKYNNKMYTIIKDQDKFYTPEKRALVLFESDNCTDWKLSSNPLVTARTLSWSDGKQQKFHRLERPQLYLGSEGQSIMFCAVKPEAEKDDSYNIHFELKLNL